MFNFTYAIRGYFAGNAPNFSSPKEYRYMNHV